MNHISLWLDQLPKLPGSARVQAVIGVLIMFSGYGTLWFNVELAKQHASVIMVAALAMVSPLLLIGGAMCLLSGACKFLEGYIERNR